MTRWWAAAAIGGAIAVAAIVAVTVLAGPTAVTDDERADVLAHELRCPDCQGLSVADSPTDSAREIRRQIGELVGSGTSDEGVREHFVARYGQWILLAPTAPAAWIVPFAVVLAGVVALVARLATRRSAAPPPGRPLSDEERRRLRAEAEALDG